MNRRIGSRRAARASASRGAVPQRPWSRLRNPYSPIEVLSADEVEKIHQASLEILESIGIAFLLPEALDILRRAGADVDDASQMVRFDRGLIEASLSSAPPQFTLHARNPERDLTFGGNHISFASVASAPNVSDLERGRRPGSFTDYVDLVKLVQCLNVVHLYGGYPVEPVDLPPETRHLDALHAVATFSDKGFHAYSLGRRRILDGIEIARIARGISTERLLEEPSLITIVNSSSPLRIDGPMLEGVIEMARHNQIIVLTPFTLSGAMAPVTIAGALALQNAEALAGIAFAQIVNPGAPCIYGGFTSNVDMKTGAPAFGTPEYTRAALASGQLARRYRLPFRSSNANAANVVDAQAAYESEMSLWGAVMGHANMVMHGAGWLEGGLCASFEKIVLDAEMLQMMAEFLEPIEVNNDTLGLEAIREVGPGGHFFGAQHTLARYETAFYPPLLSDWSNYENWQDSGARTATERAHTIYKAILAEYEEPVLDPVRREELDAFVRRRKEEGGAIAV
jgi:trimethylamine--corrinoid protein Co-methyltransferase